MYISIASIQRGICAEFGLPFETMREPFPEGMGRVGVNKEPIAHARQAAMALSVLLTEHGYSRIGYFFGGRDPTTVRYACAVVAKRRATDAKLHAALRKLTFALVRPA